MKVNKRYLLIFLVILILIILCFKNPYAINMDKTFLKPTISHIFGCDKLGRDLFSRLIVGTLISIGISVLSIGLAILVGTIIGSISGFYGGIIDDGIIMITEILLAIPSILVALSVMIILDQSFFSLVIAMFLMYLPRVINLVRGLVKQQKHMEYIVAARTYGVSNFRIIFIHIFPNIKKSIFICFTTGFASAILTEAGLGYLGLGIRPPYPTLGNMLSQVQSYFFTSPILAIVPGVMIIFIVYQMNKLENKNKRF